MILLAEIQNLKLPYIMQRRKYGEGEIRLGFPIVLTKDIYSLAYISFLANEHINEFIDVLTGKLKSGKDRSHVSINNRVTKFLRQIHEGD